MKHTKLLLALILVGCELESSLEPTPPAFTEVQVVESEPDVFTFMAVIRNYGGEPLNWHLASDSIVFSDGSSVSELTGVSYDGNHAVAMRNNPINQIVIIWTAWTSPQDSVELEWRNF